MGKKPIEVVPHAYGWAVQRQGAERTSSVHEPKLPAVKQATSQAKAEHNEVVNKDGRGRIQNKNSFGNDPFPPRDKKH